MAASLGVNQWSVMSWLEDCYGLDVSCCCDKLVVEFGNPEEEGRLPLEAATKQRLVKAVAD
jgi:hypothetical protein